MRGEIYFTSHFFDKKHIEKGEEGMDDLRLAFELQFVRRQYADIQPINTSRLINYTFIDTTFEGLDDVLKTKKENSI